MGSAGAARHISCPHASPAAPALRGHLRPSLCHGSREQRPQGGMLDRFVPSPHPTYILSWVSGFTLIPLEARVALRALQETTSVG